LCIASRDPHSAYATSAERNSGSSGRPASSAARLSSEAEPKPLLGRDRKPAVVREHALIAAELLGVAHGTAEHLRPPGGDVRTVVLAHPVGEEARGEQIVALDAVVEAIHQPPDRRLSAGPLVQARGWILGLRHINGKMVIQVSSAIL
jgi:hypothetical protein